MEAGVEANNSQKARMVKKIRDALVLMTEWNQYRALDLERLRSVMKTPVFLDLRNVYNPEKMKEAGFQYFGEGRN